MTVMVTTATIAESTSRGDVEGSAGDADHETARAARLDALAHAVDDLVVALAGTRAARDRS